MAESATDRALKIPVFDNTDHHEQVKLKVSPDSGDNVPDFTYSYPIRSGRSSDNG